MGEPTKYELVINLTPDPVGAGFVESLARLDYLVGAREHRRRYVEGRAPWPSSV
jgi:hypothetical protein